MIRKGLDKKGTGYGATESSGRVFVASWWDEVLIDPAIVGSRGSGTIRIALCCDNTSRFRIARRGKRFNSGSVYIRAMQSSRLFSETSCWNSFSSGHASPVMATVHSLMSAGNHARACGHVLVFGPIYRPGTMMGVRCRRPEICP